MYFDIRPKERREDLFDREEEIEKIKRSMDKPLIVVSGIRRIGKTSVIKVALNEIDRPSLFIDVRGFPMNYGRKYLYSKIANALSKLRSKSVINVLKKVRGVSIFGFNIELAWSGRRMVFLTELFEALDEAGFVIVFDEAQNLRGPLSQEILSAIAYAYDNCRNLCFILSGSEAGLLYDFLGIENPDSPLYGRYFVEVTLNRFTRKQSIDFLVEGFRQAGKNIPISVIEEAVDMLDGIPGWLTFYGAKCIEGYCNPVYVRELAVKLAIRELKNIVKNRSRRYKLVLKAIALGYDSWSQVKEYVESIEGKTVSKGILYKVLRGLEKMSIVSKYRFLDPIYMEAAKRL